MNSYAHTTMLVSIWQFLIQVLAYGVTHDVNFLGCADNGYQWIYTSIFGSLFTLFHMMSILMQTILVMKIFYLIPAE